MKLFRRGKAKRNDFPCFGPIFHSQREAHEYAIRSTARMQDHQILLETPYTYRCIPEGHFHASIRVQDRYVRPVGHEHHPEGI